MVASQKKKQGTKEFLEELQGFARTAEETLKKIEESMDENKGLFKVFSERMIAIRGTAEQLDFKNISQIARLGEEIAEKGCLAEKRPQIRKCIGSLWDALTTVQHLLYHDTEKTTEEQTILINRLEYTLNAFGGGRPTVNPDEIDALLRKQ